MSLDEWKGPCPVAGVSEFQADPALIEFYTDRFDESTRLSRPDGRLEFMRIQELLRSVLPPAPARVLDVGGATGVHAAWLAQDGYEVELIDIVPAHVRRARELARTLSRRFAATLGDARSLAQEDASCDACLLLGPLYHLVRPEDRARALSEAVRVTRPQGVVVAAAISRFAWPLDSLRHRDEFPERMAAMRAVIETGLHDRERGFTTAYMHRPSELSAELEAAGLLDVSVLGVEGPAWVLLYPEIPEPQAANLLRSAVHAARLCEGDPDMVAVSCHMLASGRTA